MGVNPLARIILAGYNVTHATDQFAEPVRNIMQGEQYKELFPNTRIPEPCSAEAFSTTARAALNDGQDSLTAVGLLSGFTGKGIGPGDILIVDDPYASPEDARSPVINDKVWRWWQETVSVRVHPDANVLVMFHRYHDNDLAGRLLMQGGWQYTRFPAIADANEDKSDPTGRGIGEPLSPMRTLEALQAIEEEDPSKFAGQFQGTPLPPEGRMFRRDDFKIIKPWHLPELAQWYRAYDLATSVKETADFTAGALVGVNGLDIYIRDVSRVRKEFPDARKMIVDTAVLDGPDIPIGVEEKVAGLAMVQDLLRVPELGAHTVYPMPAKGDKKQRAQGWASRARAGHVYLVEGPWNEPFIKEALAFDGLGLTHDDQIDAVSIGWALLHFLQGGTIEKAKPEVEPGSINLYDKLAEQAGFGSDYDEV